MLGKLIKKDMKATSRFFLPLILGYIGASVLGKVLIEILLSIDPDAAGSNVFNILTIFSVFYLSLFIFYLVAYYILTTVFLVYDFYKTMISDQAYLTHTLPVKTSSLIHSKIIVSVIWQIIVNVLVILSVLLLMTGHVRFTYYGSLLAEFMQMFDEALHAEMGMGAFSFCVYMVIFALIDLISGPLMFYASIALGHLSGKHRILWAILWYSGFYMAMQIITTIVMVVMGYNFGLANSAMMGNFFQRYFSFGLLFSLAVTALFYWITRWVFEKKLNLE